MKNGLWAILIGLTAGLIVYFASGKLAAKRLKKQYDGELLLQAKSDSGSMDVQEIRQLLSSRLDRKKIIHDISLPGGNRLQVAVKEIRDTGALIQSLVFNGKLEILENYPTDHAAFEGFTTHFDEIANEWEPKPKDTPAAREQKNEALTSEVNALIDSMSGAITVSETKTPFYRYVDLIHNTPPSIGTVEIKDSLKVMRVLNDPRFRQHIPADMIFRWGPALQSYGSKKKKEELLQLYVLSAVPQEGQNRISNEDIQDADAVYDGEGRPVVTFRLHPEGAQKWEGLTKKNTGKHLAIIVSNLVQSVPMVESAISGGHVQISGHFSFEEAQLLATLISAPELPVNLSVQSASFQPRSPSRSPRELLWPLILFLVLGTSAYFILNSLNINSKNSTPAKK